MTQPLVPRGAVAVIDTTLLSRLVDLDLVEFLPLVFRRILIPPEVRREAYRTRHGGRRRLRNIIREMAGFFVDCREADSNTIDILKADLDEGESAAIAQAEKTESILLLDEKKACKRATRMQLTVVRTGRLLNMLKDASAIPAVRPYHEKLKALNFRLNEEVRKELLIEAREEPSTEW